jgi:thiamine-phosphate pyrophosphorylase
MTLPPFYPVLDADVAASHGWTVPELARACFAGGARLVQVRGKRVPSGPLLEMVEAVVAAAPPDALVVVNDRPDVARMARAAGVHVGQDDVPVADAREIVGPAALVGVSTHADDQIVRALAEPLSYLAIGHIYPTATKDADYGALGLALVRRAFRRPERGAARAGGPVPIVAIGGITLDRAPEVIGAGATSVAVVSDVFATGDPEARCREYVERLAGLVPGVAAH